MREERMDDNHRYRIDRETLGHARTLRRNQTPAETTLWSRLRNYRIPGLKFRRQHPVGPYIADFCCSSHRLIIELDGDTHVNRERYDEARSEFLRKQGYRVIRFCNSDVHENIEGVMEAIFIECGGKP